MLNTINTLIKKCRKSQIHHSIFESQILVLPLIPVNRKYTIQFFFNFNIALLYFFLPSFFNFFLLQWAPPSIGSWWFVSYIIIVVCYLHWLCRGDGGGCCSGNSGGKFFTFVYSSYELSICICIYFFLKKL